MKKTNFFNAKTLAMVACVSLMFTSCDEENFSVTPVDPTDPTELPDASVIVSATTVDKPIDVAIQIPNCLNI